MSIRAPCLLACSIMFSAVSTANAQAPSAGKGYDENACRMEDGVLDCTINGSKRSDIFNAMAVPDTQRLLQDIFEGRFVLVTPADRERFRRSLEHNWRAANRHARRANRLRRRGRMPAQEYADILKRYAQIEKAYAAGIDVYRNQLWRNENVPAGSP